MRFKTTLALLVIAAAAAAFFFLVEQPRHMREVEREEREQRLTTVIPDDVHRVIISRPDVTIEFERAQDRWVMSRPTVDRAADPSVNTLIHTTLGATITRRFPIGNSDLADYGLVKPAAVIRFMRESGLQIFVIRIGDFSLRKTHCYALLDGVSDVLLLPAGLRRYAVRDLFEFRDRRVFDLPVEDVIRVGITTGSRSLAWERDGTASWFTVQDGDTIRGDKTEVETIVRELRGLRANNILFGEEAAAGFAATSGTISLILRPDSSKITVTFSDKNNNRCYVTTTDNDRVVLIEPEILHIFEKTVEDLRDRRLLSFDGERVFKLTVETPEKTLTILKTGSEWSFANPEFGVPHQEASRGLLSRIGNLKFSRAIKERLSSPRGFGFDKPSFRLTIFDVEGHVIDRLFVGEPFGDGTLRYATSLSTRMLAGMDAAAITGIGDDLQNLGTE